MSPFKIFCTLFFFAPVAWLLRSIYSFNLNRRRARQTKLPLLSSPFNPVDPLWLLLQRVIIPLCSHLPFGLGAFTRYNRMGWAYYDRFRLHSELGDAFVHVNPANNQLFIANPEAIEDVFLRRKDFQKPIHMYKMLEIFGRNANTVEGHDWLRHRKITAPPFNERNSGMVWAESLRQAREALDWWKNHDSNGVRTTDKDTRILSLHVLASAGFGMSYPFMTARESPAPGFTMTYREALSLILEYTLVVIVIPKIFLKLPFVPKDWARASQATSEFQRYMTNMLEREKQLISQRAPGAANLMSSLVRGSKEAQQADAESDKGNTVLKGLTDTEIYGNLFLYNFAGHETTGNILTYSILLLAAHPKCQDWLAEEIEYVFSDQAYDQVWAYNQFPRLKRCLAVMMESLRLYSPVVALPKYTNDRSQSISINGRVHLIPPDTLVMLNISAMHTNPRYWGEDSLTWRPSRWIVAHSVGASPNAHRQFEQETLLEPEKGTYFPWSGGARVCVGKKFSQVEFVAVMAALFFKHRVYPVAEARESKEEARRRIVRIVDDSLLRMTLQVRKPSLAAVAWKEV